jgi:hypothetical protein
MRSCTSAVQDDEMRGAGHQDATVSREHDDLKPPMALITVLSTLFGRIFLPVPGDGNTLYRVPQIYLKHPLFLLSLRAAGV